MADVFTVLMRRRDGKTFRIPNSSGYPPLAALARLLTEDLLKSGRWMPAPPPVPGHPGPFNSVREAR